MRKVYITSQYKRDMKAVSRQNKDLQALNNAVDLLRHDKPTQANHKLHNADNRWVCHLPNRMVLVYKKNKNSLYLCRIGRHDKILDAHVKHMPKGFRYEKNSN